MMDAIETPAVIIDEAIASRNITAFQEYCTKHGLNLRPHVKTHKLPYFAKLQLAAGAHGITCQKISEAEVMANAGISDILITFNIIGEAKLKRLSALSDQLERLSVTVDNLETVEGLASAFTNSDQPLNILVECDTGAGRCGVQSPEEVVALAKSVAQKPELNFDGLMIETHTDPENAWSDAAQQVTPNSLVQIMEDLKIRKETDVEAEYQTALNNLRAKIDVIDNQIIGLLGNRMLASDGIGALKKKKNVAVLQSKRWNEILGNMVLEGEEHGLSEEFILKMFKAIHQESINHQEKVING